MSSSNPPATLNILIVQCDETLQKIMCDTLAQVGYTGIVVASSARKALSILRVQPISLLICSVELDELDGWRLSRLVRSGALKCQPEIPIILTMTNWCRRIAEVTAREHGINGLLSVDDLGQLPCMLKTCISQGPVLRKPTLLVVEDDPDTSDLIQRILRYRFVIDVADDGEKGLNLWLEKRHDLILLDVMLPKLSGPEVMEKILAVQDNQPIVIMTAHAPIEQAEELLINGATDFIPKPFRPEPLRTVTEIALRRDDYLVSNQQFEQQLHVIAEKEKAYRVVSDKHEHILNHIQTMVMELDSDFAIRYVNLAWVKLLGFSVDECLERPFGEFLITNSELSHAAVDALFSDVLNSGKELSDIQLCLSSKTGKHHWVEVSVSHSMVSPPQGSTLIVSLEDITHRKFAQEQLEYLAMHDSLTGLFNRHYFESTLESWSMESQTSAVCHGLIYIDLDYFKVVNDTFGHHQGDVVLKDIGQLIKANVRGGDVLCRIGGDEFSVLLNSIDTQKITVIAEGIREAISGYRFESGNKVVDIGSSIGMSVIDGSRTIAEDYLMQADTALYVAKRRGRNKVHLYDPNDSENEELKNNIDWSRQVRKAISEDRAVLFLQPIYNIKEQKADYYEMLIRMIGEDGKLIFPDSFIPALESTGDMKILDRWVIKRSIEMLQEYDGLHKIAINLSAHAYNDDDLVVFIETCLETCNVSPEAIIFELTESASLSNMEATRRVVDKLHQLGCGFAVDDFGSGFSSFTYLKELPADYIKLDGSFIRNLHIDKVDQALVRSMIEVIKTLGRQTVAEFVENEEILQFLADNGVDYAQGYHIGRPAGIETFFPSN